MSTKSKRKSEGVATKKGTKKPRKGNKENETALEVMDLCGQGFLSPSDLMTFLEKQYPLSIKKLKTTKKFSIHTDSFPRGCMQVLLDHIGEWHHQIVEFQHHYGMVRKYQLQNADLKLLLKEHGGWLTSLRLVPQSLNLVATVPPAPKLQGCGYRWTTLHARCLHVLELPLANDTKQQLLDGTRKTPLQLDRLEELVLRHVGSNTTRDQLEHVVANAPVLGRLVVHGASIGDDLETFLVAKAKEHGKDDLEIEVHD
ncbi:expressed unknown protein [Seminavis robusta]|uniref:Uncharacterized protein n=1 Tax=Seminavis robusta TaxID=568900 RepID=A0A9N8HZK1_9STRA|nr:expressed unknown protein [Seminavis robusta]|eukprot:Sro2305_g322670.1 n/a (256) ;mRNA; r:13094-13861